MRLQIKWINGWAHLHGTGPDGRRIRRALKTRDARQAEEAKTAFETRIWKAGVYGAEAVVTFDECALAYAQDGGDTTFILRAADHFRGKLLSAITPKDVRDAARALYPDGAGATLNRQGITPIRAVINYGHQQGWCAPIRVKQFPTTKPKRVAIGRTYIDQLRPHCNPHLSAMVLFLYQNGRRISEIMAVRPSDVDLKKLTIEIPTTKNGKPFTCHLTTELAQLLADLEPRSGRVFGYQSRSAVRNALKRACKRADLEYLGTHQIGRHSFATALSDEGWSSKAIAEAGGWESVRLVSEVYDHPEEPARKAAQVFGRKFIN